MSEDLKIEKDKVLNRTSRYSWVNIQLGQTRIGKARMSVLGKGLTINSINIFPDFERNGYARNVIELLKRDYEKIVADRVRNRAIRFWKKMDFEKGRHGNFIWERGQSQNGANFNLTRRNSYDHVKRKN